jgi:hypothetical protein
MKDRMMGSMHTLVQDRMNIHTATTSLEYYAYQLVVCIIVAVNDYIYIY